MQEWLAETEAASRIEEPKPNTLKIWVGILLAISVPHLEVAT
jgi:hypothetical protein